MSLSQWRKMFYRVPIVKQPQGPHSHILMVGGPKDFFWSDILAKRDFFGSVKDAGIFRVAKTTEGFFWVLYFSSAQIKNNISAIYSFLFQQNQS